ncbi:MAG: GIY-YIG nuclease family protein [Solirubrobacteraceae bacterium]
MNAERDDDALVDIAVEETVGSPGTPRRIYAYTVIGKDCEPWTRMVGSTQVAGKGLIKVGETTKATAEERVKQQLGTAYPNLKGVTILLDEEAKRTDGIYFRDHAVHAALQAAGITRAGGEWFEAALDEVKAAVVAVRSGREFDSSRTDDFPMRPEQEEAVALTAGYFTAKKAHEPAGAPKFLWNAKMRFGKTFSTFQLAREMGWTRLLVLTYKPAVQASWRDDLLSHVDFEGWRFIDRNTPAQEMAEAADAPDPLVWFASFQDLGGKTADGHVKEHNEAIHLTDWDCIVLDEYHFGAWRDSARDLYDPTDTDLAEEEEPDEQVTDEDLGLSTGHYLYLSGTPFRAITNGEFTEDAIFNWTYPQEQAAKADWSADAGPNPYVDLPGMKMYCYEIGEQAGTWADDGEFNGFSLSEYFKAAKVDRSSKQTGTGSYVFEDPTRVSEFLEMLRGKLSEQMRAQVLAAGRKPPFPYESADFHEAVRHAVWYMPDVASCFAMRDMLATHSYFKDFKVVVGAGTKAGQGAAAKPPVNAAIAAAEKGGKSGSITLSCGKLMTGVTVPEWGAILMLRSLKSPETYFQAAFRVQSPWRNRKPDGTVQVLKDTCLVFEFDPNRALSLVAEYGMRLASSGDVSPKQAIGQLIDYLPIYQFSGGSMTLLDADEVMDWATAGVGATALAQRWSSPVLVDVNEATLSALLDHPELLEALEQIEDFRNLADTARQIVTSTKSLKKAKRQQGGKLDPDQKKERSETAKRRKEVREKLQKFVAKVPVFMYVTDFREEALKDVIESLDSALFERVTGLTVDDFRLLNRIGVFNAQHMNAAIYQFKSFENTSLHYADEHWDGSAPSTIGLWDRTETTE